MNTVRAIVDDNLRPVRFAWRRLTPVGRVVMMPFVWLGTAVVLGCELAGHLLRRILYKQ